MRMQPLVRARAACTELADARFRATPPDTRRVLEDAAGVAGLHAAPEPRGAVPPPRRSRGLAVVLGHRPRGRSRPHRVPVRGLDPRRSSEDGEESYELFDLKRDPGEQNNLAPGLAARVLELRAKVGRIVEGSDTARDEEVPAGIDEDLRNQLKALGYIGN